MVVIVIALAKTDEGDQPAVTAAVLCPVGLAADHMTEGVDGESGIEHHEHPEQAAHEEPTDTTQQSAVPPESDAKGNYQPRNDDQPIVLVLPENHRVAAQSDFIFANPMRRIVEEPAAVAVPKSSGRIIGIFIRVRAGVMANVVRAPDQRRVLQRPSAGDQHEALDPIGAVKTLVCHQPVVANRNPHPRHDVHDEKVYPVKQRIADIVAIEGDSKDRGSGDGTEEETGTVRKS